jgi:hypothetical protein
MKATFIVTSCINNVIGRGVFTREERYKMTFDTFESIRKYAPGSKIIFADASIEPLPSEWAKALKAECDVAIHFNDNPVVQFLSKGGLQSQAETELLRSVFQYLTLNMFPDVQSDRYFKITGRCCLDEGFDLKAYENIDNFVYKKRVVSWMHPQLSLLDTRLWSVGHRYLPDALKMYQDILPIVQRGFDLEHATWGCIPQDKLIEFDRVYAKGRVASDGTWRYD